MSRTIIIDGDVVVYKVAEGIAESFEVSTEEDDEYIYKINKHIMAVVDALWILEDCELIFVTGREGNEKLKELTINQLDEYYPNYQIFFRAENDYRQASKIKQEIYEREIKGKYNVLFAIDDDIENIKMFYKQGIHTLHCRYGRNK